MDCTKKSQEANVKCEKRVMILSCLLVLVCACVLLLLAGNRKQKEAVGWYNTIANSLCHASFYTALLCSCSSSNCTLSLLVQNGPEI